MVWLTTLPTPTTKACSPIFSPTATEFAPLPFAWAFYTDEGYQSLVSKDYTFNALAVRPGQVAAAIVSVLEPVTLALFGIGLAGLGWARRR
jgi:hypothetical protein